MEPFHPPQRTLMGPGPSDVSDAVLAAMARPTIGHLDPEFVRMMDEVKALIQYAFSTSNELTFAVSAPGSAGMETCFSNLLEPGDTAIVCVNGVFGSRMLENVERCAANAVRIDDAWGHPVSPDKVETALKEHPEAKVLAFVHAETSTGVRSDAETLCALAKRHECLTIVDCVTSLGGIELLVDDWGIDAAYSGSQKCLSGPPGLSPVTFSPRAAELIQNRRSKVQSWFLDINLIMDYWGEGAKRTYHHTAPVNNLYGLHEALRQLQEEGLEASIARHRDMHELLREGLEEQAIEFVVEPAYRLPQLNSVWIPKDYHGPSVREKLLSAHSLEIGAGLGDFAGRIWRIGLMGHSAREENVKFCLSALEAEIKMD